MIDIRKVNENIVARSACIVRIDEVTVAGHDGNKPIFQVKLTVDIQNGKPAQTIIQTTNTFLTIQEDYDITNDLRKVCHE